MFIAKNLRYLRVKNNLKQKDIQEIGIKRSRYSNYENGVTIPALAVLESFSSFFGISVNDLLYTDLEQNQYGPSPVKQQGKVGLVEMENELLKQKILHLEEALLWKDEKLSLLEERLDQYGGKKKGVG